MPLSNLNPEQFSAATAPYGHNLIIASAGTGKTSTIVGRIAHLISKGVKPHEILLLTFTNKAAGEMVERIAKFFGKEVAKGIKAGTFHATSYKWLKELQQNVLLKQPAEIKTLFRSVYEKRSFHHLDAGSALSPAYLYDQYALFQNDATENFGKWMSEKNENHTPFVEIYEDIIEEFETLKKELGFVSFNDLLILMRDLLKSDVENPFKEVLIDEYQDTNPLQTSIIDSLSPKPSLFCVGDYDQSIYAFNGARIEIIASFTDRYEGAKVFTLDKNYRSTAPILALANKVIRNNPRIYPKKLEVVRKDVGTPPALLAFDELFLQYEGIAKRIANTKTPHLDIAIIYRNNASADGVEAMLREFDIPAKRKGSNSFFETREIRVILDTLTLFLNPKDLLAFIHIFEYAPGIGSATAKELFDGLTKLGDGNIIDGFLSPSPYVEPFKKATKNYQLGLFEDIAASGTPQAKFGHLRFEKAFLNHPILAHPKLTSDSASFVYQFYKLLKARPKMAGPSKFLKYIIDGKPFEMVAKILARKRGQRRDKSIDPEMEKEAFEKIYYKTKILMQLAGHYDDTFRFLNAMILGGSEMSEGEGVNLLSIHASKGLEFEEVYIVDLMDGRFPNRKLMSKGGSLDEERRLFYVAVTRAKTHLYLSFAKHNKVSQQQYIASPFLIEAGMVKQESSE
jgi:DNA helicase II / ATP-dependent DNA helicase PcrA